MKPVARPGGEASEEALLTETVLLAEARTLPLCAAVGSMPIMVQAAGGRVFFASAISLRQIAGSARPLCVRGSPVRMRRIDRPAPL